MSYVLLRSTGGDAYELVDDTIHPTFGDAEVVAQKAWTEGEELLIAELKLDADWEKPMCPAETFRGTHLEPPEYCENDAMLGSEYCNGHGDY